MLLRTSPVLDRSGGAFPLMKLAWSLGLGAELGDGRQRMPMISLDDYLGVVQWAADNPARRRPVQPDHPRADHQRRVHRRAGPASCTGPGLLRAPAAVLRTALGELAEQLLGDMYVVPERLQADGYRFYYPDVYGHRSPPALAPRSQPPRLTA